MHNLVTEDSLVGRSSEFEESIQNGERSSLRALCEKKSQECKYVSSSETCRFFSSILSSASY